MTPSPKLILHGGAGRASDDPDRIRQVRTSLDRILRALWQALDGGSGAKEVVILGCQMLEDDPLFNAGTGSAIQHDGQVRMSASLMGSAGAEPPAFSGVINAMHIPHPIDLAAHLQTAQDRVLDAQGAERLARELRVPLHDPITPRRLEQWLASRGAGGSVAQAGVLPPEPGVGTVGVVALDVQGGLYVGTSTGGRGFERPGRVSDSATPAGNFATKTVAVSCTGIGEHIQDECLAPKIALRAGDGLGLEGALRRSFEEARQHQRWFGAIALDAQGHVGWGKTTDVLLAAYHDGQRSGDTLDEAPGWAVSVLGK